MVSRLTAQKGSDLLALVAGRIAALPAQLAILGTGDRDLERALVDAARAHPGSIATTISFDERLAHRIEAGADAFLMPSRFEPSGLNQMYSQRYGTPPVARATGGLVDSIVDATPATLRDGTATGFLFDESYGRRLLGSDCARTGRVCEAGRLACDPARRHDAALRLEAPVAGVRAPLSQPARGRLKPGGTRASSHRFDLPVERMAKLDHLLRPVVPTL